MKRLAEHLVSILLEAGGVVEPFAAIPREVRRHLIDNIYQHLQGNDRLALLRHIEHLSAAVQRNPVAYPEGKWWMPVIDNGALLGLGPWFRSYVPDSEALPTDNTLVPNPILPEIDKRNWVQKLERTRPGDARRLAEDFRPRRLDFRANVYKFAGMNTDDASIDRTLRDGTPDEKIRLLAALERGHPRLDEVWCAVFGGKPADEMTVVENHADRPGT